MTKANPFVYADNDPVNQVDPTGKASWGDCIWMGIDAVAALLGAIIAIAATIVTIAAPNAITAFFALVGLGIVVTSAHGVYNEWIACEA